VEIKLVVLEGKAKGREIPLPPTQFIIGRGSRCHLRPHSEQVSKVHCAIGRMPGNRVFVRDLKSLNKTLINDVPIAGSARVFDGDVLTVGPLKFRFAINNETPNQAVHEKDVLWLMDKSADAFDVESSDETKVIEISPELLAKISHQAAEATVPCLSAVSDGPGLSAGKLLRDYVRGNAAPTLPVTVHLDERHAAFVDKLVAQIRAGDPPTRDNVVAAFIDAVAACTSLEAVNSLEQLKSAIAGALSTPSELPVA
jgi:pSer/pThr/pTyr-binding forkhead associated (FHA) protein